MQKHDKHNEPQAENTNLDRASLRNSTEANPSQIVEQQCQTCEDYDFMGFGKQCPCTHVNGKCTTPTPRRNHS